MRIGEFLVSAHVINETALATALQTARQSSLPIGRTLMDMGELTEVDLYKAIELQAWLRQQIISKESSIAALNMAVTNNISVSEACLKLGFPTPPSKNAPPNQLADLLCQANLVDDKAMAIAWEQSRQNNIPIGRSLVLTQAISLPLLAQALTALILVRDGKITQNEAIAALKKVALKQQGIIEPPAIKNTEPITLPQPTRPTSLSTNIESNKPSAPTMKVGELLNSAGLISEIDQMTAVEKGLENRKPVGQVLIEAGRLTNSQLMDSLRLQEMVFAKKLTGAQAVAILKEASERAVSIDIVLSERKIKAKESKKTDAAPKPIRKEPEPAGKPGWLDKLFFKDKQ